MSKIGKKRIEVNGVPLDVAADQDELLINVIRRQLGLTGTKLGCGKGQCGACNVIMDGKVVRSCITKWSKVPEFASILTVEGLGKPDSLHAIQWAFIANGAVQCGFCTPGFIMATKALLDENPSPTRDEVRDWFQKTRNVCRCTGYVQIVDAVMEAAEVLRGEKPMTDFAKKLNPDGTLWGSSYPRPSAAFKVTGLWDFGDDARDKLPEGALYAAIAQAEVSHANIKSIDTSEAEKMPGVFKVITAKDVKGNNRINGLTFPSNKGDGWDRPILCDEKIFQYGDAYAMVCADTEEQARAAAKAIKIDLEVLPAYMNAMDAIADDAMEIHPGTPNLYYEQGIIKGDETSEILKKCAFDVDGDFYLQRQPHLTMETDVGYGYYDENDVLCVHSKSIGVHIHHAMIVDGLGLEPEKLRLIQNNTGGTFGYKFSPTMESLIGVAVMATGRPVFLRYDMEQHITYTGKRSPFWMHLRYGADEAGRIKAMESEYYVDHGPYSEFGDLLTVRGVQFMGSPYGIENIRGKGHTVCTNHAWGSAFRGYGSPQAFLSSEVLVDMLAERIGMDPLDIREVNVKSCAENGGTFPSGQAFDAYPFPEMVDRIRPKYEAAKTKARENSTDQVKRGVGISLGIYGCGLDGEDSSSARVELLPNGVRVYDAWEDHGQGADAGTRGTASKALEPLGLKPEQILLYKNDTGVCPNSGPAGGSRSQVMTGNAIRVACEKLVHSMKKADGTFRTYDEMVAEGLPLSYEGTWTATMCSACDPVTGQGAPFPVYMYGLFMTEVAVDLASGKTTVEAMTLIADVGVVNNKDVVDGQLYGGMAQGIGLALTEDFEDIAKQRTIASCGVPYIKDVPDALTLDYVETKREHGPFGAAGCGELPLTSPHASIINAIHDATGAWITHLPAYPDRVKKALDDLKKA